MTVNPDSDTCIGSGTWPAARAFTRDEAETVVVVEPARADRGSSVLRPLGVIARSVRSG